MSDNTPGQARAKLIDDPRAPEFFADGVRGFFLHNGILRIGFEVSRADHGSDPAPVASRGVTWIVMPSAGARALAVSLFDFLKKMGLEPGQVSPSVTVQSSAPRPTEVAPPEPARAAPATSDGLQAPEFFCDGIAGFFFNHGVLRIAFEVTRFDHGNPAAPTVRVLVARVAIPAAGASSLAVNLFDFLKKMGIDPASVSTVPTMQ